MLFFAVLTLPYIAWADKYSEYACFYKNNFIKKVVSKIDESFEFSVQNFDNKDELSKAINSKMEFSQSKDKLSGI